MLRTICLLVASLISAIGNAHAEPSRLFCFERGQDIWVANLDGSNPRKITRGSAPDLSSDGKRIAFNTDTSNDKDVIRHIAIANVEADKVTVFEKEIPSENCQRPVWSPQGRAILFSAFSDADWHLALINGDGSGFRYLKKTDTKGGSLWSFCWTPDGRSIYAQDLTRLYLFDTTGNETKSWKLDELVPSGSFNSGSTFAVSPDGSKILMEVDIDNEEAHRPDWDGPPPSIWVLDISSEHAMRLTPKGVLAWHPSWIDSTSFLCAIQNAKEKTASIYRVHVQSPDRQLVIKNANAPSFAK